MVLLPNLSGASTLYTMPRAGLIDMARTKEVSWTIIKADNSFFVQEVRIGEDWTDQLTVSINVPASRTDTIFARIRACSVVLGTVFQPGVSTE